VTVADNWMDFSLDPALASDDVRREKARQVARRVDEAATRVQELAARVANGRRARVASHRARLMERLHHASKMSEVERGE
jgi:ABC-type thiamine transport system ATPase subunit